MLFQDILESYMIIGILNVYLYGSWIGSGENHIFKRISFCDEEFSKLCLVFGRILVMLRDVCDEHIGVVLIDLFKLSRRK